VPAQSSTPKRHEWITHALGRTCAVCGLTQAKDEYDDNVPCRGSRSVFDSLAS